MLAVTADAYGDVDLIQVTDVEEPVAGDGQVLVEVRAAGVNPADAKKLRGQFGTPDARPIRFGSEASGIVVAIGPGVDTVAVGDEVIVYPTARGMSQRVVVKADATLPKPPSLSFEAAAGLLSPAIAAYHAIEAAGVGEGDRVVVHGASGAVGLAAVQLARLRGATVVGTASPANFELVRSFGATPVAYGDGLLDRLREAFPDGATAAIDAVGTPEAIETSRALVPDDRIASLNGFGLTEGTGIHLLGAGGGADPGTDIRRAARPVLVELAGRGDLRVVLGPSFPLADARDAFALIASGHPGGKIVLVP